MILGNCLTKKTFLESGDEYAADVNGDRVFNIFDIIQLKRLVEDSRIVPPTEPTEPVTEPTTEAVQTTAKVTTAVTTEPVTEPTTETRDSIKPKTRQKINCRVLLLLLFILNRSLLHQQFP